MAQLPSAPLGVVDGGDGHPGHCGGTQSSAEHPDAPPCWDSHCPQTLPTLHSAASKPPKPDADQGPLLALLPGYLRLVRAGPCPEPTPLPATADFPTTPLYYSLCVLRL